MCLVGHICSESSRLFAVMTFLCRLASWHVAFCRVQCWNHCFSFLNIASRHHVITSWFAKSLLYDIYGSCCPVTMYLWELKCSTSFLRSLSRWPPNRLNLNPAKTEFIGCSTSWMYHRMYQLDDSVSLRRSRGRIKGGLSIITTVETCLVIV